MKNEFKAVTMNETCNGDSLHQFLTEIGRIPRILAERELELGKCIKENGPKAKEAKEELMTANLRLVVYRAKKYIGHGVDLEDLIAMGTEGLIKAVDRFDYSLGNRFSTYAVWWIDQAILRGIANEGNVVRIPVHMKEAMDKVEYAQKKLTQMKGGEPSIRDIAEYTGLDEDAVKTVINSKYTVVSFDAKVGDDKESTLEEFIVDDKAEDPCDTAVNNGLKESIGSVLEYLSPKEARVLALHYGIGGDDPMTMEDIGKLPEFGVTRERIRQIENKAIIKIRRSPKMVSMLKDYVA